MTEGKKRTQQNKMMGRKKMKKKTKRQIFSENGAFLKRFWHDSTVFALCVVAIIPKLCTENAPYLRCFLLLLLRTVNNTRGTKIMASTPKIKRENSQLLEAESWIYSIKAKMQFFPIKPFSFLWLFLLFCCVCITPIR